MCNCHTQSQRIRLPHFSHHYSSSYMWKTVIRTDSFAYRREYSTVDVSVTARDRGVTAVSRRGAKWLTQNWRQVLNVIWKRHTHAKRSKKTNPVMHATALFTHAVQDSICQQTAVTVDTCTWYQFSHSLFIIYSRVVGSRSRSRGGRGQFWTGCQVIEQLTDTYIHTYSSLWTAGGRIWVSEHLAPHHAIHHQRLGVILIFITKLVVLSSLTKGCNRFVLSHGHNT